MVIINVGGLVSITKIGYIKMRGGASFEMMTMVESITCLVSKYSLDNLPMSSKRSLHELTNMTYTIGDFRACNGGILKSTNSALVELSVMEWSLLEVDNVELETISVGVGLT